MSLILACALAYHHAPNQHSVPRRAPPAVHCDHGKISTLCAARACPPRPRLAEGRHQATHLGADSNVQRSQRVRHAGCRSLIAPALPGCAGGGPVPGSPRVAATGALQSLRGGNALRSSRSRPHSRRLPIEGRHQAAHVCATSGAPRTRRDRHAPCRSRVRICPPLLRPAEGPHVARSESVV